ncbi:MAG: hypothetical protein JWO20_1281, partial [Candidatus Angelobacter sp.]|nr:hypothetical protein [Candidatus Angelobacter sp.]
GLRMGGSGRHPRVRDGFSRSTLDRLVAHQEWRCCAPPRMDIARARDHAGDCDYQAGNGRVLRYQNVHGLVAPAVFGVAFWIGFTSTALAAEWYVRHTRGTGEGNRTADHTHAGVIGR